MPGKNAAQRISELVERGVRLDGNAAMVNGLNQLFDYSPEDPYRQHAYRLEQVHKQLDLVQVGLTRLGIPDELYAGQLAALRNGFSSSNLSQPYQNLRGQFTGEVRLALLWAAFVLEDEGGLADQTALGELVKSILGVIADVQASSLPPTLRIPVMLSSLYGELSTAGLVMTTEPSFALGERDVPVQTSHMRWATLSVVQGQPGAQRPVPPDWRRRISTVRSVVSSPVTSACAGDAPFDPWPRYRPAAWPSAQTSSNPPAAGRPVR